jgi:hypothetical protein
MSANHERGGFALRPRRLQLWIASNSGAVASTSSMISAARVEVGALDVLI